MSDQDYTAEIVLDRTNLRQFSTDAPDVAPIDGRYNQVAKQVLALIYAELDKDNPVVAGTPPAMIDPFDIFAVLQNAVVGFMSDFSEWCKSHKEQAPGGMLLAAQSLDEMGQVCSDISEQTGQMGIKLHLLDQIIDVDPEDRPAALRKIFGDAGAVTISVTAIDEEDRPNAKPH